MATTTVGEQVYRRAGEEDSPAISSVIRTRCRGLVGIMILTASAAPAPGPAGAGSRAGEADPV